MTEPEKPNPMEEQTPDSVTDADILIGRVVDGEADEQDLADFERLAADDPRLWRAVALRQQDMASLSDVVDHEIALARGLPGVRRIIGFTRPAGYHEHPDMPIEEYVALRRENGEYHDPVLQFHLGSGAKLISIHPDYRPADTDAGAYGVLIEYPLL